MAKESPIKRPVVRLPEGGQLGLFGSKELQGSERHAERSGKVIFNQGSVEDLFIGSVRVEEHLRVTGEREAFVVREVLSEMDFRELESGYRPGGRRPYSPRSMLGLVLYGVMQGVTSLRELERLARVNLGCMWASGGITPDHSVIGRFLTQHESQLSESQVSELTRGVLGRTGSGTRTVAGDGTVIQAAGSAYRQLKLEAARAASDKAREAAEDSPEDEGLRAKAAKAKEVKETLEERVEARRSKGKEGEHLRISATEPEAVSQPMKDKRQAPSYKPSVLANEMRVVLGLAVHPSSETGVVSSLLDQAQALGEVEELLVDAGYHCDEVIDETLARDISLLCPQGRTHDEGSWTKHEGKQIPKSEFIYDAETDTYGCPQGERLVVVGRFRGSATQSAHVEYGTKACGECPIRERCTRSARGRRIKRYAGDEAKEALRGVMEHPQARKRYRCRQAMVEPVFSVLRGKQGLNRFRRRGLSGVRLEFALHIMAYNLSRVVAVLAYVGIYVRYAVHIGVNRLCRLVERLVGPLRIDLFSVAADRPRALAA